MSVPKHANKETEQLSVFQLLLSLGADIRAQDHHGRNVLLHMIGKGEYVLGKGYNRFEKSLREIVKMAPDLVNQADKSGWTALHYAVSRATRAGEPKIAQDLLQLGADPSRVTMEGENALHLLLRNLSNTDLCDICKDLVKRGVDINARDHEGQTPLFRFSRRSDEGRVPYRHKYEKESDSITMLNRLGADFFARDRKGRGLLHIAAQGYSHRYKLLIDQGLDNMAEDFDYQTPIDVAAAKGNKEVLELLKTKDR